MKVNWLKISPFRLIVTSVIAVSILTCLIADNYLKEQELDPKKEKKVLTLFKSESDELAKMRQPVRDVAIYFLSNRDDWNVIYGNFMCGGFHVWVMHDKSSIMIHSPKMYELEENEKEFFYNLYQEYLNGTLRFYKYEEYIDIKIIDNTKKFPIWKRIEG